jgi:hypothetical protein
LKEFKRHGEAASRDPAAIDAERARVQALLHEDYHLRDIFNIDETGCFMCKTFL